MVRLTSTFPIAIVENQLILIWVSILAPVSDYINVLYLFMSTYNIIMLICNIWSCVLIDWLFTVSRRFDNIPAMLRRPFLLCLHTIFFNHNSVNQRNYIYYIDINKSHVNILYFAFRVRNMPLMKFLCSCITKSLKRTRNYVYTMHQLFKIMLCYCIYNELHASLLWERRVR